jgi:GMP synthase (glutamine-hydrolysing)
MSGLVLVLDFGGQYKELIAGMVRNLSVYSQIMPGSTGAADIERLKPLGIILTGGPNSVYLPGSPKCDREIFNLGIPVLGICYGMHLMCHTLGGKVASGNAGEYGRVTVSPSGAPSKLFGGKVPFTALMSHKDIVTGLPDGFRVTAKTAACTAACENKAKKLYAVQFHPETKHTRGGREIIKNFLYDICGAPGDYKLGDYIDTQINQIRARVGANKVLLALSGGVDSSVCAGLLSKAVPGQLTCIFVDHGFMRLNEGDGIERVFSKQNLRFIRVNAQKRFLAGLEGVTDPEMKRKIIGGEFIRVFEEEAARLGDIPFLAQGTIYPDVVESGGKHGAVIKSHHNVGGLPEKLKFTGVVEPLSRLFKDEVRALGRKLGLPLPLVNRQPFPGPGLAIRVIGEVTRKKLDVLRQADAILREELDGLKGRPNQYFCVLTDTRSVGVKGDDRTYNYVIAVRAVKTDDFMTCEYAPLPHRVLSRVSSRITGEIPSASRVVYDITSKPPATVEWE